MLVMIILALIFVGPVLVLAPVYHRMIQRHQERERQLEEQYQRDLARLERLWDERS